MLMDGEVAVRKHCNTSSDNLYRPESPEFLEPEGRMIEQWTEDGVF